MVTKQFFIEIIDKDVNNFSAFKLLFNEKLPVKYDKRDLKL